MITTLTAIAIMTGLGMFFGLGLAVAHRFLKVEEDPRLEMLEEMLPGSNCGACGEAGCRAFAEVLLDGVRPPSGCTVASPGEIESIAAFLGVDPGREEKRVARLHCAGGLGLARQIAEYEGFGSCRAAHVVAGGGKGCGWGCLGLDDCLVACDFDAIHMNEQRLPVVSVDHCTACGDCVEACPRDLFEILPLSHHLIVQCAAPLEGDEARAVCQVACDACERCVQDAAPGLIRMAHNLPVVDYSAGGPALPAATDRCPTGAIRWVEHDQFDRPAFVPLTGVHLD
ncbi:MAG: (Fe-S)-binding protein [Planctomycetota bacterium]|jgi:Na+-translocating ferredoxin:NAD+ oxidoreductase RNF subunit RnfB